MAERLTMDAQYAILKKDPVMRKMIARSGPLKPARKSGNLYYTLLRSVAGQQLSVKAADTIFKRFESLFGSEGPVPENVIKCSEVRLRSVGFSLQKAGYIKSIAVHAEAGWLEGRTLSRMEDEALIKHLTAIKGVGIWTAQMVMMFAMQRQDVFPVDDLGIRLSMLQHYGLKLEGAALKKWMHATAEKWRPCRTLACRHLWLARDTA